MKKLKRFSLFISLTFLFIVLLSVVVFAKGVGDPSGAATGTASDIIAKTAGSPTQDEILTQIGKNRLGINYVWVMMTGMLIFFFQCGFAMILT